MSDFESKYEDAYTLDMLLSESNIRHYMTVEERISPHALITYIDSENNLVLIYDYGKNDNSLVLVSTPMETPQKLSVQAIYDWIWIDWFAETND